MADTIELKNPEEIIQIPLPRHAAENLLCYLRLDGTQPHALEAFEAALIEAEKEEEQAEEKENMKAEKSEELSTKELIDKLAPEEPKNN